MAATVFTRSSGLVAHDEPHDVAEILGEIPATYRLATPEELDEFFLTTLPLEQVHDELDALAYDAWIGDEFLPTAEDEQAAWIAAQG